MEEEQRIGSKIPNSNFETTTKRLLQLLISYWWLLILTTAVGASAAYATSRIITPVFASSTTIMIDNSIGTGSVSTSELNAEERLARTYSEIIKSRWIMQQVASELGVDEEDLGNLIVNHVTGTQLIRIEVENTNPVLAADVADKITEIFADETQALQTSGFAVSKENMERQLEHLDAQILVTRLGIEELGDDDSTEASAERSRLGAILAQYNQNYTELLQSYEQLRLAEIQSTSNIIQLDPAEIPDSAIRPRILLNTVIGAIFGLFTGIAIVLFIDYQDDTIKKPSQIESLTQVPVIANLGLVNRKNGKEDNELVTQFDPRSPVSESFRDLRTAILFSSVDKRRGIFLVTSSGPTEGKSWVSANLANVLAQAGNRVLIIDADLRRPRQHIIFDTSNDAGLTMLILHLDLEAETSEIDKMIEEVVRKVSFGEQNLQLHLVTSGRLPPNPSELLGTERMDAILEYLAQKFDYIILDTPPAMAVTDPYVLAVRSDGVLLVAAAGQAGINQFSNMVNRFRELRVPILGIAFNKVTSRDSYYGYYGDRVAYSPSTAKRRGLLARLGLRS